MKRPSTSFWILLLAVLLSMSVGYQLWASSTSKDDGSAQVNAGIEKMMLALQLIRKNYVDVDRIKANEILENALAGMLSDLDPYSVYFPPEKLDSFNAETKGSFGGIGVSMEERERKIVITAVFPGSPAGGQGVLPLDEIRKVNDVDVTTMQFQKVPELIRGPEGTSVKITIYRPSEKKEREVNLVRSTIQVPYVTGTCLLPKTTIGYTRILEFGENTASQMQSALQELEQKKATALIVDLRFNPGGLIVSAQKICSYFLPDGALIVTTRQRSTCGLPIEQSEKKYEYRSESDYKFPKGIPVVLLVNQHSASAAEIVAGCLKDHKRAVLVGTKTFGKGSVQNVFTFDDGSGIKLTIAKYFTPDPKRPSIHGHGIQPDYNVPMDKKQEFTLLKNQNQNVVEMKDDSQLQKAVKLLQK